MATPCPDTLCADGGAVLGLGRGPKAEFLGVAEGEVTVVGTEREKSEMILDDKSWPSNEARVGTTGVFLSERCWRQIAGALDLGDAPSRFQEEGPFADDPDAKRGFGDPNVSLLQTPGSGNYYDDKAAGYFGSRDLDLKSEAGASAFREGDMFRNMETRSQICLLYTSPSPRDGLLSRMPSSA